MRSRVQDEFSAFYDQHRALVRRYAVSRVGESLGEEVVSETFEIAWQRFGDISEERSVWLLAIAAQVVGRMERAERRQAEVAAEVGKRAPVALEDPAVAVAERQALLGGARRLSPADRQVLVLRAWHGMTADQAAAVLGISTPTYFVRLHRARRRLVALVAGLGAVILVVASHFLGADRKILQPLPVTTPTAVQVPWPTVTLRELREWTVDLAYPLPGFRVPKFQAWEVLPRKDRSVVFGTHTVIWKTKRGQDTSVSAQVYVMVGHTASEVFPLNDGVQRKPVEMPRGRATFGHEKAVAAAGRSVLRWDVEPGLLIAVRGFSLEWSQIRAIAESVRIQ